MIRLFSMFSGYGGAEFALQKANIEYECIGYSEIKKHAIKCYEMNHPGIKNYGDCTKIDPTTLPDFDLLTGGFPCFEKGTLVLAKRGYVPIEKITTDDEVLTHLGRWRKVINVHSRVAKRTRILRGGGFHNIVTTDEHPFYARRQYTKCNKRIITEPEWICADFLQPKSMRLGLVVPPVISDNHSVDFWWIVGRYLADGWRVRRKDRKIGNGRIVIACNDNKLEDTKKHIKKVFNFCVAKEMTCNKIHIVNSEFYRFIEQFGDGALNKHISGRYLGLEQSKAKALFEGYISGDGSVNSNGKQTTTISMKLAYSMSLLFQNATGRSASMILSKRPRKTTIEGRIVNQHSTFTVQFPNHNRSAIRDGRYSWRLLRSNKIGKGCRVYNISVEEDESYIANNVIVHNCQAFSSYGFRKGFEDARGTLFGDIIRIANVKRPRYMLLENVEGILNHDDGNTLRVILKTLEHAGYDVSYRLLNSMDYGVPQSRPRVYFACKLGSFEFGEMQWPEKRKFEKDAFELLESDVDVKYKLNDKQIAKLNEHNTFEQIKDIKRGIGYFRDDAGLKVVTEGYSVCITAMGWNYTVNQQVLIEDGKIIRFLTPKECFRLMGFFDDECKIDGFTDKEKYDLAGNGWDTRLASKVLKALLNCKSEANVMQIANKSEDYFTEAVKLDKIKVKDYGQGGLMEF